DFHPPSRVVLLVLVDRSTGARYRMAAAEGTLGRDPASSIVLTGDSAKAVSSSHARVFAADGQWWVQDNGSRNGTFVGDTRLENGVRHALTKGVVVGLGTTGPRLEVTEAETRFAAQTMLEGVAGPVPSAPSEDLSRTVPLKRGA